MEQTYFFLLFSLTIVTRSYQTYSNDYYRRRKNLPMYLDHPLTLQDCGDSYYGRLRSCQMAMKKRMYMKSLSRKYFCQYKDQWYESRYGRNKRAEQDSEDLWNNHKYKKDKNDRNKPRSRTKRGTNHCSGTKVKQVILQAYEASRPSVMRELLHDPENHLYQTLFIEKCQNRAPINGFYCLMHKIRFKAAVWSLNPHSTKIEVLDVVIDGYCALSQL